MQLITLKEERFEQDSVTLSPAPSREPANNNNHVNGFALVSHEIVIGEVREQIYKPRDLSELRLYAPFADDKMLLSSWRELIEMCGEVPYRNYVAQVKSLRRKKGFETAMQACKTLERKRKELFEAKKKVMMELAKMSINDEERKEFVNRKKEEFIGEAISQITNIIADLDPEEKLFLESALSTMPEAVMPELSSAESKRIKKQAAVFGEEHEKKLIDEKTKLTESDIAAFEAQLKQLNTELANKRLDKSIKKEKERKTSLLQKVIGYKVSPDSVMQIEKEVEAFVERKIQELSEMRMSEFLDAEIVSQHDQSGMFRDELLQIEKEVGSELVIFVDDQRKQENLISDAGYSHLQNKVELQAQAKSIIDANKEAKKALLEAQAGMQKILQYLNFCLTTAQDALRIKLTEAIERLRQEYTSLQKTEHPKKIRELDESLIQALKPVFIAQYEAGIITFLELRDKLLGTAENSGTRAEVIDDLTARFKKQYFANRPPEDEKSQRHVRYLNLFKNCIINARHQILLSAPSNESVAEFTEETLMKVSNLLSGFLQNNLIEGLADEEITQLFYEFLNQVLYPGYRIEMVVGFGGTLDDPNIRIPSYVIPALQQIKVFLENGVRPPKLVILNGQALAVEINQMDSNVTQRNAGAAKDLIYAFIRKFYPECMDYVEYRMPTYEECKGPTFDKDVVLLHRNLNTPDSIQQVCNKELIDALQKLQHRGGRHGDVNGRLHSLQYAAFHPQEKVFGIIQRKTNKKGPNAVMKFGGNGEAPFNIVQDWLAAQHLTTSTYSETYLPNTAFTSHDGQPGIPRTINITMSIGANPPYYSAGEAEITLKRFMELPPEKRTMEEIKIVYREGEQAHLTDTATLSSSGAISSKNGDKLSDYAKLHHALVDLTAIEKNIGGKAYVEFLEGYLNMK